MMHTTTMKQLYDENGYLVVERLFEGEELGAVQRRVDEIIADPSIVPQGVGVGREGDTMVDKSRPEAANKSIRSLSRMAHFDAAFQEVALNPKLLEAVRALIGPRVKVFRDQMLLKPPGGQAKPVHQDQSYFRVTPEDAMVTVWIALDDATTENGCMVYVPGSHRHGIFEIEVDPERPVHHVPRVERFELEDEVLCPVPKGSAIFHHGCTLHRSEVNHTTSWRRALIFHFATTEASSDTPGLNEEVSLEID